MSRPMIDHNGSGLGTVIVIIILFFTALYYGGKHFGLW